ncbi:MAG: hypothetical protein ACI8Y4_004284 [Candidatus Poriferisodalaceae bacterium]|jgi:hypothetical protein
MATADGEGRILLRDPETFQALGPPMLGTTTGFRPSANGPPMVFTTDGQYLITTLDGQARLWDIESRQLIGGAFASDDGVSMAASANGRHM